MREGRKRKEGRKKKKKKHKRTNVQNVVAFRKFAGYTSTNMLCFP